MESNIFINIIIVFSYFLAIILALCISYMTTFNNSNLVEISFEEAFSTAFYASLFTSFLLFFIEILFNVNIILYLLCMQLLIGGFLYYKIQSKIKGKWDLIKLILATLAGNFILSIMFFYIIFFMTSFVVG